MNRWIEIEDGGYENLDHAVCIKAAVVDTKDKRSHVATLFNGDSTRFSLDDDLSWSQAHVVLTWWSHSLAYLHALAADGSQRHALNGTTVAPVSARHREAALTAIAEVGATIRKATGAIRYSCPHAYLGRCYCKSAWKLVTCSSAKA